MISVIAAPLFPPVAVPVTSPEDPELSVPLEEPLPPSPVFELSLVPFTEPLSPEPPRTAPPPA